MMAISKSNKFLLCIPHGGMNDTLCQIEYCWRYATKFGRHLIIDTQRSGLMGDFSDYFDLIEKSPIIIPSIRKDLYDELNSLTCYPNEIQGRLNSYEFCYSTEINNVIDPDSGVQLSFNSEIDFDEDVIVHEQWGGGSLANDFLHRVSLSDNAIADIESDLDNLPNHYIGIHVRNTDLKTDFKPFFDEIYQKVSDQNILICSDDSNVIHYAQNFFKNSDVYTLSPIPQLNQKPLHLQQYSSRHEKWAATINSIRDLILLGNSDEILFVETQAGHTSGFSRLAQYLFKNKKLINQLLKILKPEFY